MGETSNGNKKWKENFYWNHFHCIRFKSHLSGDFHKQLAIPKKFACNLKKKLPESVTLRGPSGVTWDVGLVTKHDTLFFKDGWEKFVKDHSLAENDFLIFQYNGESCFDVLLFDQSLCEKEDSYFLKSSTETTNESKGQTKKRVIEEDVAVNNAAQKSVGSNVIKYYSLYASNRRPVTKQEKAAALNLARAAATADSLVKVMELTNVYERFQLDITSKWFKDHFLNGSQYVILRVNEKMWRVRVDCAYSRTHGWFNDGWKFFSLQNCLEESDVCVFTPAKQNVNHTFTLDVSIFRVVQETTPATGVTNEVGYIGRM
ncbi:hypothetical protein SLEP1_g38703 [Rubroshorea leprosula]|uniref:TF-B3 domain-containing protein n=1 Tax=Rubroshorea leprosula TaxID=152421 RepID=A0AAV5KY25_9ROSI|nr:hypothetical protein SLEP1_g38703 [Rubroshorea leprosula]